MSVGGISPVSDEGTQVKIDHWAIGGRRLAEEIL